MSAVVIPYSFYKACYLHIKFLEKNVRIARDNLKEINDGKEVKCDNCDKNHTKEHYLQLIKDSNSLIFTMTKSSFCLTGELLSEVEYEETEFFT